MGNNLQKINTIFLAYTKIIDYICTMNWYDKIIQECAEQFERDCKKMQGDYDKMYDEYLQSIKDYLDGKPPAHWRGLADRISKPIKKIT